MMKGFKSFKKARAAVKSTLAKLRLAKKAANESEPGRSLNVHTETSSQASHKLPPAHDQQHQFECPGISSDAADGAPPSTSNLKLTSEAANLPTTASTQEETPPPEPKQAPPTEPLSNSALDSANEQPPIPQGQDKKKPAIVVGILWKKAADKLDPKDR
ncbi:uncharacterized protein K444DRAFT_228370 [Hyaloscypha bicolor E]|uniref:Uncharacterized protein n=1 Tax=Hyaloscypha bicolor E TaxID=1095630 RepID=A0A2J6SKG3_9HELO|nr:uncharacterized protein K444DRAFT_228370 [Hyaloscypha bicolor E]PMD51271.1 hypothetical protein K444DRAFT_228370 [Hyaloscypha bicolor E]